MPSGSCTFEADTCDFDSESAFQPWILNEEGKGLLGEKVKFFCSASCLCHPRQLALKFRALWGKKRVNCILHSTFSRAARVRKVGSAGSLCLPSLVGRRFKFVPPSFFPPQHPLPPSAPGNDSDVMIITLPMPPPLRSMDTSLGKWDMQALFLPEKSSVTLSWSL